MFLIFFFSIKVDGLRIRESNLTIDQRRGLTLSFENVEFDVNTKWCYKEKNW